MNTKRVAIYVVAAVIIFLGLLAGYFKWDRDLLRERCAALSTEMDAMEMEWRRVIDERNNLNTINGTLTSELNQWRTRPPETVEVVRTSTKWRTVPADCRKCIEQYELDKSYTNPPVANVPAETIRVDIKDVLGADVATWSVDVAAVCPVSVCPSTIPRETPPNGLQRAFLVEVGVGYGLAGPNVDAGLYPLSLRGDKYDVDLGAWATGFMNDQGAVYGNAVLGVRIGRHADW